MTVAREEAEETAVETVALRPAPAAKNKEIRYGQQENSSQPVFHLSGSMKRDKGLIKTLTVSEPTSALALKAWLD